MNRLRKVLPLVLRPFQLLIYFASGLVPRSSERWALGTWSGQRFADNAAAVYLHCLSTDDTDVEVAWITARRSIRDDLRRSGRRAMTAWSPSGIVWCLRSGVFVYDTVPKDVNFWLSKGARLVLLRHGIGLKKIERAIDSPDHRLYKLFHGTALQRALYGAILPWHLPIPDLVTACSEEHAAQAVEYFGVERQAVRLTGFPRHDRLALPRETVRGSLPAVGEPVPDDRPVFLYMPTFRESLSKQDFDWSVLDAAAEHAGVTIAIKLHLVDADRGVTGRDEIDRADSLRLLDPYADPIELFGNADGLITDFSSTAFDFLLLDRPIVYYVPDIEEFAESRPLIYPLDEVAAGPICTDVGALSAGLEAATGDCTDVYRARRAGLRRRFHEVPIGGASARVVAEIKSMSKGASRDRGVA